MELKVSNINKSFNNKKVVNNISFSIDHPSVFGLLGSNGAGKTTIIRSILGIIDLDSGTITWNNRKVSRKHLSIGYLPEERGIYSKVSVKEQLLYLARLKGLSYKTALIQTKRWCDILNITEYLNYKADQLSKGNQQKVQLISAIIHSPKLLILDEPFSGLDPVNTEVMKKIIEWLISNGTYVILSCHQMNFVEEYCKDILIINRGNCILQGELSQIKKDFGFSNLLIQSNQDISSFIYDKNKIIHKTDNYIELNIGSAEEADNLLKLLVSNNIQLKKFEIKEPSLQEIFIKKVGGQS